MSGYHDFCRAALKQIRQEAKTAGISLPLRITALLINNTGRSPYFIEAQGFRGEFYYGDCAFEAKTKYFRDIIDGKLNLKKAVQR